MSVNKPGGAPSQRGSTSGGARVDGMSVGDQGSRGQGTLDGHEPGQSEAAPLCAREVRECVSRLA